jgi:ABC-type ATPase with predicted acetyltransferase domain
MTNGRNHLIVVLVQMARKLPLATIIGLNLLWFVRSR